jgi:hypothetical protein
VLSLAAFASEKLLGLGLDDVRDGKFADSDVVSGFSEREETASSVSEDLFRSEGVFETEGDFESELPLEPGSAVDVCTTVPEESIILIGTSLRAVAVAGSNDAWTNDAVAFGFLDVSFSNPADI